MSPFKSAALAFMILMPLLSGCTRILSVRTDEQAWDQFQKERFILRIPASALTPSEETQKEALFKQLSQVPVRTLLLKCGSLSNIEECYRDSLHRYFDEHSRGLSSSIYRIALQEFQTNYSYNHVYGEVTRFHKGLLSGVEVSAREGAREFLEKCESSPNEAPIERFDQFLGGTTEMPKSIYSCLGSGFEEKSKTLLEETSERLGLRIVTKEAFFWILRFQVRPLFQAEMIQLLKRREAENTKNFRQNADILLAGIDLTRSEDELIQKWAPMLRERYPYGKAEQWISETISKAVSKKTR